MIGGRPFVGACLGLLEAEVSSLAVQNTLRGAARPDRECLCVIVSRIFLVSRETINRVQNNNSPVFFPFAGDSRVECSTPELTLDALKPHHSRPKK